jgi:membrane-associated phospholipid phosphatase
VLVLGHFFPAMLMIGPEHVWLIASFVFAFTFVIPAVNLLMFRYLGSVRSLKMESRQERVWPFIFISALYVLVAFLFFYKLPFSINFNKIMVIVALLVIASTTVTFFLRVSVHSLAMWGMVGILLPLVRFAPALLWPTAIIIVLSGLVISSRLLLGAHTPRETIVGSIAGLLVGYGGMVVLF